MFDFHLEMELKDYKLYLILGPTYSYGAFRIIYATFARFTYIGGKKLEEKKTNID